MVPRLNQRQIKLGHELLHQSQTSWIRSHIQALGCLESPYKLPCRMLCCFSAHPVMLVAGLSCDRHSYFSLTIMCGGVCQVDPTPYPLSTSSNSLA
jgi:hypothetical protein